MVGALKYYNFKYCAVFKHWPCHSFEKFSDLLTCCCEFPKTIEDKNVHKLFTYEHEALLEVFYYSFMKLSSRYFHRFQGSRGNHLVVKNADSQKDKETKKASASPSSSSIGPLSYSNQQQTQFKMQSSAHSLVTPHDTTGVAGSNTSAGNVTSSGVNVGVGASAAATAAATLNYLNQINTAAAANILASNPTSNYLSSVSAPMYQISLLLRVQHSSRFLIIHNFSRVNGLVSMIHEGKKHWHDMFMFWIKCIRAT